MQLACHLGAGRRATDGDVAMFVKARLRIGSPSVGGTSGGHCLTPDNMHASSIYEKKRDHTSRNTETSTRSSRAIIL